MPAYKAYGNAATTPSRRARKGMRNSVFLSNRKLNKKSIKRKENSNGR